MIGDWVDKVDYPQLPPMTEEELVDFFDSTTFARLGTLNEDDPLIYSLYSCLQCSRCDLLCRAKGQNLDVSDLIRQGKYLLSQGLIKG